jgi:hypothetical protein
MDLKAQTSWIEWGTAGSWTITLTNDVEAGDVLIVTLDAAVRAECTTVFTDRVEVGIEIAGTVYMFKAVATTADSLLPFAMTYMHQVTGATVTAPEIVAVGRVQGATVTEAEIIGPGTLSVLHLRPVAAP